MFFSEKNGRGSEVANTTSGPVRGQRDPTTGVTAFRGIPYAKPPVGGLRWKAPQQPEAWRGVRDCTAFAAPCLQPKGKIVLGVRGAQNEDCLYLNIWTKAGEGDSGKKRPVMVWIHGGGFTIGSGSQPFYDGRNFAAAGAVLVTINYRLGPFGFMAHPALSKESPQGVSGNYGMLDQIAALKWVQANIGSFGGDAGNVTIFGESAGAVSVGCLLASPLAGGLFHRAILQSGSAAVTQSLRGDKGASAEDTGIRVARQLGIESPDSDTAETATFLRGMSARDLLKASNPKVGLFGKGNQFWPCVDGYVFPLAPMAAVAAGKHHDVPVLLGTNADEGTLFLRQIPIKRPFGYRLFVRTLFPKGADRVRDLFPADSPAEVRPALNKLVTVATFVASVRRLARALEAHSSPVWLYHFTRVYPAAEKSGMGATHGAEIYYVFDNLPSVVGEPRDGELSGAIQAAWLRFAETGNPNGGSLPAWPAYTREGDAHLVFGDEIESGRNLWKNACDLFDELATENRSPAELGKRP